MVKKRPHPTHWTTTVLTVVGALARVRGLPRRVVVDGSSMSPTLEAGDRLLVVPNAILRPGQVVALRDPRLRGRILVKRIGSVSSAGVEVLGDNPGASTDSRHFGPVPTSAVLGRVVYRYHPPDRSGRIPE